ncbi:uncharacterized protein NECHADRAFT_49005 [Fusarium vanettenii 77-13-4]|uniref:Mis6 domain protein n=1 Tax=Fusarium vanettenii (strain ATCC MYA-4622 / CBS 123669 / FGSC 9596 / NRRL 45880 / 77-13-4) TaxID=660122 RepID=C7YTU8_FUSV7|nr:uncharacterized protein NECHADRAFT_49005 [Fusarium vanettenii 77-13-4]EEU44682.1 hypothetical protein NECHADRAFT_49005 [Fusarium vanettenii 77-13-4]
METDTDPASEGHAELRLLVGDVIEASKLPAKSRTTSIKPTVANLTSLAYEWGILPDTLDDLINLITTPNHLDQASQAAIIRNLYPISPVSRDSTLRVVSCLGHGKLKPSLTLQAALLKWLIMVHHNLESPQVLSQAYPVLFNLLDGAATRLSLSRQTGNDPCLIGLLRVFKDYYPEVIVGEAVRGKASSFKHPDLQWRARLDEIQEAHQQLAQEGTSKPRDGFRVHRTIGRSAKNKLVPIVHTSHATEDSVTLEEIENATDFAKKIDKLELPNQMVAVLVDPLLQKLMLLRPNEESDQRIANWLNSILEDVTEGFENEETLFDMMDILRDYVVSAKNLPPLLLNFFAHFLPLWSGSGRSDSMLEILSYAPLLDFQELYQHIFQPLETAILDNTPESQLALLALYKNLLHHWTVILQSSDPIPKNASKIITDLISHANPLALALIQTRPTLSVYSAILDFYEQNARLVGHETLKNYIRIELPPSFLIYILFFSSSVATVSRICAILACYKKGFELAMLSKPRRDRSQLVDSSSYNRTFVNLFNGFLMDMCNCFWRGRAFGDSDANAHGCMVPRRLVPVLSTYVTSVDKTLALTSILSLSHSPVLCLQSIKCVRDVEDAEMDSDGTLRARHEGPVTQHSLGQLAASGGIQLSWQNYRIKVLETLSAKELAGITDLLKNTMTVLRKLMDGEGGTMPTGSQASQVR